MSYPNPAKNTVDDFELEEVIFTSNRGEGTSYAIQNIITDFDIYEHLDKPFLSMKMAIVDTINFVQSVDLQGGESVRITIQSLETKKAGEKIVKNFIVDKVIQSTRPDDKTEVYYLHCFEDIVLTSSLVNINRHYNNTPAKIVQNIINEYLGRNVIRSTDEYQTNMQVIVPNMHPIEAASWIKNRITSVDGFPFYLYSTLNSDDMYLVDLGQLLSRSPINKKAPMTWIQSTSQQHLTDNVMPILNYEHKHVDDILSLIRNGYAGASYNFLNTLTGQNSLCEFDVTNDVFEQLRDHTIFKEQNRYNYPSGAGLTVTGSQVMTKIASNGSYKNANYSVRTLDEESDPIAYKKRITGAALKNFMSKAPITVQVNGRPFIAATGDYTIGNVVRLLFLDSQLEQDKTADPDYKKSGDYLMYSAKHSFSTRNPNRVVTTLLCARLSMYSDNLSVGDFMNV